MTPVLWYLVALVGVGALAWYEHKKAQIAEALNDNIATKEKVDAINKDVIKNDALIEAEKQKQADLQKNLDEEKAKNVTKDNLLDFFNKSDH